VIKNLSQENNKRLDTDEQEFYSKYLSIL